jgi:hypothetical protein
MAGASAVTALVSACSNILRGLLARLCTGRAPPCSSVACYRVSGRLSCMLPHAAALPMATMDVRKMSYHVVYSRPICG